MRNGSWWWTENDIDFDLHLSLDERGPTEPDFESVCGRLVMQPSTPTRPLWHIAFVPAARPGLCGIVIRVHHAVSTAPEPATFSSACSPHLIRKVPTRALPCRTSLRRPPVPSTSSDFESVLPAPANPITVLLGAIGPTRSISSVNVGTSLIEHAAQQAGGTLNDAYLVAVGGGLRFILQECGEPIPKSIAVSVPVAVTAIGSARNAVGFMIIDLPLRETDPQRTVAIVAKQTAAAKPSARAAGTTFRSPRIAGIFDKLAKRQHRSVQSCPTSMDRAGPLTLDGGSASRTLASGPVGRQCPRRLHRSVLQRHILDRNPGRCRASPTCKQDRPSRRTDSRRNSRHCTLTGSTATIRCTSPLGQRILSRRLDNISTDSNLQAGVVTTRSSRGRRKMSHTCRIRQVSVLVPENGGARPLREHTMVVARI